MYKKPAPSRGYRKTQKAPIYTQQRPIYTQKRPIYAQKRPIYTQQRPIYTQKRPIYAQKRHNCKRCIHKRDLIYFKETCALVIVLQHTKETNTHSKETKNSTKET